MIVELADYVTRLQYEDLSERAIEVGKQAILDSYGNMVFGRYSEASERIMEYAQLADTVIQKEDLVSLIGEQDIRTSSDTAVFVHTMMARCADLDDGYRHAMGHPGSVLVPLLLSVAQLHQADGKQMITAIVAAYDVYARLGEAINPFMYRERGFDATGVCGAVAAAALVSKLTKANAAQTKDAMGIASLFTGGLIEYQNDGTSGKILCSGWAALTGLRAVRLASCGFTGPDAAIEGKYGFFQAFQGTSGYCDSSQVLKNLGQDFKITDIYFKRHACQRGLHATLDAVLELRERYDLTPSKIKSVDVRTSSFVYRLANPNPTTAIGAQASTQFTSAVALKYGRMDSENLIFRSFEDPEVQELVQKITVTKDEGVQQYLAENPTHFCAARVVLRTHEGNSYEKWMPLPLGDMGTPFGWDMLEQKFNHLIADTPCERTKQARFDLIRELEKVNNIHMLFRF
ncbi:MmgE/PrpD family protein [Paenibacillus sp. PCH8]|uniref:MmgE/PrpD family protein n=1 Tax=Paenibacillus sp. PCH8 TaxID=2066524 RepID=UPI002157F18B|nr:MmgE/PrpD family protein [Paenibacillus sp. PCH8]